MFIKLKTHKTLKHIIKLTKEREMYGYPIKFFEATEIIKKRIDEIVAKNEKEKKEVNKFNNFNCNV